MLQGMANNITLFVVPRIAGAMGMTVEFALHCSQE
jgi:hypothetical protein